MVQADATGFSRKISQGDLSQNNAGEESEHPAPTC